MRKIYITSISWLAKKGVTILKENILSHSQVSCFSALTCIGLYSLLMFLVIYSHYCECALRDSSSSVVTKHLSARTHSIEPAYALPARPPPFHTRHIFSQQHLQRSSEQTMEIVLKKCFPPLKMVNEFTFYNTENVITFACVFISVIILRNSLCLKLLTSVMLIFK